MNGFYIEVWAAVGLATGMVLAPTAFWLAGTPQRQCYRLAIAGATTGTFLLTAMRCSTGPELLVQSVFIAVAVLLTVVDVLVQRLPRALIWPTCMAVTGILIVETLSGGDVSGLLRAIAAAAVLSGSYLAVAVASCGGLGAGDVRLAVLIGGVLGRHDWSTLVVGCALGFVCTGVVAAILAASRRMPTALPHGPGMLAGTFVAMLL